MIRIICFVVVLAAGVGAVSAEPYWSAYEGNDYPEDEGWSRLSTEPLAERWLEDGALVIDASVSGRTNEWYRQYPASVAPETGELFVMQWGLNVEMFSVGSVGADVTVLSDDCWAMGFDMNNDTIRSAYGTGLSANYEPGVYHDFEMRSPDMRWYELYIDGDFAFEGPFGESLWSNRVAWGKSASGPRSITRWDYFRYGVVPEPSTAILLLGMIAGALGVRPNVAAALELRSYMKGTQL